MTSIGLIVEGHGDVPAARELVRRIAGELYGRWDVEIAKPFRLPRGRILSEHLSRAVSFISANVGGSNILVIFDADDDCALRLAAEVRLYDKRPLFLAVAVREFEAWFLAGLPSLASHSAIADASPVEIDPDEAKNAKSLLESRMSESYRETLHQPAFASMIDLRAACRSRSFAHLVSSVGAMLDTPG